MKQTQTLKFYLKDLVRRFLYLLPIQKNKIVFLNSKGRGYGDNPKYIAEEILRQGRPWKMRWLVRGEGYVFPDDVKRVNLDGLDGFYELSTAKCIISNCKNNIPSYYICKKKKKQFYLQTWHGDFALKYIEKEIEDTFSPGYVAISKADSKATNAALSGNSSFSTILRESFWLPESCEIWEYGVPRNDIYFSGEKERNDLRLRNGFSLKDKILLYAPTFRDDSDLSCYNIDFDHLRMVLPQDDNTTWRVIIRLHPNISSQSGLFTYNDFIKNGSDYPDQQELCMMADCLITDYSSMMGDFLLMKKPVFLYVPDLEKYADRAAGRGLRDFYYQLPFSFSHTQQELETHISEFDETGYSERVRAFMKDYYNTFDDGHASERVVNHLSIILK